MIKSNFITLLAVTAAIAHAAQQDLCKASPSDPNDALRWSDVQMTIDGLRAQITQTETDITAIETCVATETGIYEALFITPEDPFATAPSYLSLIPSEESLNLADLISEARNKAYVLELEKSALDSELGELTRGISSSETAFMYAQIGLETVQFFQLYMETNEVFQR